MSYWIVTFETSRNGVAWELDTEAQVFLTADDALECAEEWADGGRGTYGMVRTLDVMRVELTPTYTTIPLASSLYWRPMVDEMRADRECERRADARQGDMNGPYGRGI